MDSSMLGMGLAAISMIGSGAGMGYLWGKTTEGIARNPSQTDKMMKAAFIGMALIESIALYGFVIALLIMTKK